MIRSSFRFSLLLALAAAAFTASARTATYTLSGTATGILNDRRFDTRQFTITAIADTDDVQALSPTLLAVVPTSVTIFVSGIGSDVFTAPLRLTDDRTLRVAGLEDVGQGFRLLGISNDAFATYDMTSSLGIVSGGTLTTGGVAFATQGGSLRFNNAGILSFFTADVAPVPEPASLTALGLGAWGLLRRRRRTTAP